jgi:hypothetical protein
VPVQSYISSLCLAVHLLSVSTLPIPPTPANIFALETENDRSGWPQEVRSPCAVRAPVTPSTQEEVQAACIPSPDSGYGSGSAAASHSRLIHSSSHSTLDTVSDGGSSEVGIPQPFGPSPVCANAANSPCTNTQRSFTHLPGDRKCAFLNSARAPLNRIHMHRDFATFFFFLFFFFFFFFLLLFSSLPQNMKQSVTFAVAAVNWRTGRHEHQGGRADVIKLRCAIARDNASYFDRPLKDDASRLG